MNLPIRLTFSLALAAPVLNAQTAKQLWDTRYYGPGAGTNISTGVAVDGSGNMIVTGYSYESGSGMDYYTAKYAAVDGALLWEKRHNGNGGSPDYARALALDASGNAIVTGEGYASGGQGPFFYTAKYAAADGVVLWEKLTKTGAIAYALAVDSGGNVVVTGIANGYDYYTAKYAATDGALLWEKRYNGTGNGDDFALAVAVDGSDNVVVTGYSPGIGSGKDYYTAKYAVADGALLWEKRYNGTGGGSDSAYAVAVDGSNNVVVTGSSTGAGYDYYTAKYAAVDGALLWEKRYSGSGLKDDGANAVVVDDRGDVVVTGSSTGTGGNYDYYTAKYAAEDGDLLWEKRYNGTANSNDYSRAVAVDVSGNVVVTGSSYFSGSKEDFYTVKYAAATGAVLWDARYTGWPYSIDRIDGHNSLALTSDGGAVICGYTWYSGSGSNYATVRYAPPNLIDYAFGLDPANGSSQLPQWEVSNGTISTTFTQPPGVSGITYGAEWTTDLAVSPWILIPDTGTGGTHTFSVPIGPDPRKFFRFTVSQP